MEHISLTKTAQSIIGEQLHAGAVAIDATLGNGHDSLFLALCVGDTGQVYGFDVQIAAVQATARRLQQQGLRDRAILLHVSHAAMHRHIPPHLHGHIQAVMFNLGYLPGSDKSIITQAESSLQAVRSACDLLASPGVMTVIAYPGHAGGEEESRCLQAWLDTLDTRRYAVRRIFSRPRQAGAPRLFVIRKAG